LIGRIGNYLKNRHDSQSIVNPDITEKMLNQQLKELEKDEIVNRTVRSKVPLQVDYSFTEYGKTLIPSIESLCQWGKEHLKRTEDRSSEIID
jgi:DNA-binding HxlR family transcriptional regulator